MRSKPAGRVQPVAWLCIVAMIAPSLAPWMQPFQPGLTAPTWQHVLVLIVGAILTPGTPHRVRCPVPIGTDLFAESAKCQAISE